ncbi:hypothetical protein RND81_02G019600 [Saponaria officinalis]|uniref:Transmembrane protein n=1 Tax=Saponaria officinalis TaxID=3572 RepID=A0AAW1MR04_SAPOF
MQIFYKSSRIICFSLIFIILISTSSSFSKDNDLYGGMLTKDEHGVWKFVVVQNLNRRILKSGSPFPTQPSPMRAPPHGHNRM